MAKDRFQYHDYYQVDELLVKNTNSYAILFANG